MLFFYLRKNKKEFKQFNIKVKHSLLSEEEKEKLLFQVFDLLLSNRKKTKSKKSQNLKGYPMLFLTKDMVDRLFCVASDSVASANRRQS